MNIQYGPIKQWPGTLRPSHKRIRAPFKSSHTGTLRLLERELRAVSAESPVVQLAMDESQFTRSGQPYSTARANHPGVIVSFMKRVRRPTGDVRLPLSFPCDTYQTWESNLRAVALGMEALRRVDRYGITSNSEQYTGFKALPPAGPDHERVQTVEDAAAFVGNEGGPVPFRNVMSHPDVYRAAYRRAAARFHPDANGGTEPVKWAMLQAAKTLLDAHHGL